MVGDKGQHAVAGALDAPLRKADELDVVVVEPFGVAFGKLLAIHRKVVARGLPPWLLSTPRSRLAIHWPVLAECPEYGGLPSTTMTGALRLMSLAARDSSASHWVNSGKPVSSCASSSELVEKRPGAGRWQSRSRWLRA